MFFNQAFASNAELVKSKIIQQANSMGVDPAIVLSIAKVESGFRQEARGAGGPVGVFQLMPSTARGMGYNPYELDQNIKCGITYYKNLYNRFGSMEKAVAAYNLGPAPVMRCNCVPQSAQGFVSRIMKDYRYYKAQM